MKLSYYPGCSLHSTAVEYNDSTEAVFKAFDVDLVELPDWNCCGATAGHSTDRYLALALPLRNLVIAEAEKEKELVLPCAACYNLIKAADHYVREGTPEAMEAVRDMKEITGKTYSGSVHVSHPLEVLSRPEYAAKLPGKVVKPLKGLKIVPYYGCLLTRPGYVAFDNTEQPHIMDDLMKTVGVEVRPWSYKTDCCGGGLTLSRTDLVVDIITKLIQEAKHAGADALVTACPLCQITLDTRQNKIQDKLPVFHFTELMGISFGHKGAGEWMKKHIVDPVPLLKGLHLL